MKPIEFEEMTGCLRAPRGEEESIKPLPMWCDGREVVSCWKASWRERLVVLLTGRVWLRVLSGGTQPPAMVQAGKFRQIEPGL